MTSRKIFNKGIKMPDTPDIGHAERKTQMPTLDHYNKTGRTEII